MARIVNRLLLNTYHYEKCLIGSNCRGSVVAHHIKAVKSGGDDIENNLMALCHLHHVEIHKIGRNTFIDKYFLNEFMKKNKWEKCSITGKWFLLREK